jgi:hypothetical protein
MHLHDMISSTVSTKLCSRRVGALTNHGEMRITKQIHNRSIHEDGWMDELGGRGDKMKKIDFVADPVRELMGPRADPESRKWAGLSVHYPPWAFGGPP